MQRAKNAFSLFVRFVTFFQPSTKKSARSNLICVPIIKKVIGAGQKVQKPNWDQCIFQQSLPIYRYINNIEYK